MSLAIEPGLADRSVDIDLIRENSERAGWSIRYRQLEAGPLEVHSTVWYCGQILLKDESINRCLQLVGESPLGVITVLIPDRNRQAWVNGHSLDDGQMVILFPGNKIHLVTGKKSRIISMQVPQSVISAELGKYELEQLAVLENDLTPAISDKAEISQLRSLILNSRDSGTAGRQLSVTESSLISKLGSLVASGPNQVNGSSMRISFKQISILRKVDMYLESHLREEFRMSEISRASGVSERTLERLFKYAFGITPSAYIKSLRLHKARTELARQTIHDKSIAHIAMDQGFTHLGRFSVSYREHFGQSLSEFRRALVHEVL